MRETLEIGLAMVLFFPTFCIVSALYVAYPRQPRPPRRWLWDLLVVAAALAASIAAMVWGFRAATGIGSAIWRQLLATLLAYGAYLLVIACALLARKMIFASRGR